LAWAERTKKKALSDVSYLENTKMGSRMACKETNTKSLARPKVNHRDEKFIFRRVEKAYFKAKEVESSFERAEEVIFAWKR